VPKLNLEQFVQGEYDRGMMTEMVRQIEDAINRLSSGAIYQNYNATTAAPTGTTVSHSVGDFVENSIPTELGSAGSMYIVKGWVCIAAGTPGTFREARVLTGN
jgi:hypothetical protein